MDLDQLQGHFQNVIVKVLSDKQVDAVRTAAISQGIVFLSGLNPSEQISASNSDMNTVSLVINNTLVIYGSTLSSSKARTSQQQAHWPLELLQDPSKGQIMDHLLELMEKYYVHLHTHYLMII